MDPMFKSIFEVFADKFAPALPEESTLKLTSTELFQIFSRFYNGEYSEKELFTLLIEAGYIYQPESSTGSISFYWYLKEKK